MELKDTLMIKPVHVAARSQGTIKFCERKPALSNKKLLTKNRIRPRRKAVSVADNRLVVLAANLK